MSLNRKPFELPKLRKIIQSSAKNTNHDTEAFWDVKFYPYDTAENARPIFAVSNKKSMLVCRIIDDDTGEVEILRSFEVSSGEQSTDPFVACGWSFVSEDEPLLLGAGDQGLLRVFNVVKGDLQTTLRGHGQGNINDLAIHPRYPWIVASASQDTSIRIWDLRRWSSRHESPSVIICGHGHGHKQGLLSVTFHDSGRYLISGGHDHRICVWTLPDLSPESSFWDSISIGQRKRSSDEILVIHYPHFISSAVHRNFVDCVRFYGDRVFSKCAEENKIVFWEITGFDSNLEPPDMILAPKTQEHLDTRNGFMRTHTILPNGVNKFGIKSELEDSAPFTRLLEFTVPDCLPFYIRFQLLKPSPSYPSLHPILAIGNSSSQVFFWDLEVLNLGHDGTIRKPRKPKPPKVLKKGIAYHKPSIHSAGMANRPTDRGRALHTPSSTSATHPTASSPGSSARSTSHQRSASTEPTPPLDLFSGTGGDSDVPTEPTADRERFPLHDPHKPIKAQSIVQIKPKGTKHDSAMTARSVAWSRDGRWCIVAGETFESVGKWGPNMKGVVREIERRGVGVAGLLGRGKDWPVVDF